MLRRNRIQFAELPIDDRFVVELATTTRGDESFGGRLDPDDDVLEPFADVAFDGNPDHGVGVKLD
jgi:hypothetical protein